MLLVDSIYIHESGAKALLEYFIEKLIEQRKHFFILFDKRLTSSFLNQLSPNQYQLVTASEGNRKQVYQSISNRATTIFCFANVPPPIHIQKVPVFIYFHNVLLLSHFFEDNNYSIGRKFILLAKRSYIQWKNQPTYHWIVQSDRVKQELSNRLSVNKNQVHVLPFFREELLVQHNAHQINKFIYVADGVPQKNHTVLFQAWEYLQDRYQLTPELHLTIPALFTELIASIQQLQHKGIKIINHGVLDKAELNLLYQKCGYLIFPSLRESFGLPLIEAVQAGCGVLAADLPYVYDVIRPSAVFNPVQPQSIAEVVVEISSKNDLISADIKINNNLQELLNLLNSNASVK
jgi:glycosyltransferase involved in cell wall biosynthesis